MKCDKTFQDLEEVPNMIFSTIQPGNSGRPMHISGGDWSNSELYPLYKNN